MYEFLTALFNAGADGKPEALTAEELVARINEAKDLKLVNIAAGGYVSKDKFDAKVTELDGVKTQLNAANDTIKSYKDMDIEGIKQSAANWETKHKEDTAALKAQLEAQERSHREEMFFSGVKFTSKAAEAGIKAEFAKKEFKLDEGKFLGAQEWLDGLMQNDEYKAAFMVEDEGGDPGKDGDPGKPHFTPKKPPQPKDKKLTLSEMMAYQNAHPDAQITFD